MPAESYNIDESLEVIECALCGAEIIDKEYPNQRDEVFCSRYHRERSNKQLKQFILSNQDVSESQLAGERFQDKLDMYRNEY